MSSPLPAFDPACGERMHAMIRELYPLCRSITGPGIRQTLEAIRQRIPLEIQHVPSGTAVLDWTVPNEWNIRDAWVKDERGEKVIDFQRHTLHILNYSVPLHRKMGLAELQAHLFSLPDQPDLIPYRTSYYKESWGFCLSQNNRDRLQEGEYEVFIDTTLAPGVLSFGELVIPGAGPEEVLISTHACHPSLANDNLSGIALCTELARSLAGADLHYTYRFVFIPGTIGAITWLGLNENQTGRIRAGLVAACVGDPGFMHYKQSRRGNALIDRAAAHVLRQSGERFEIEPFSPYGYDERQYCSPGFNLPMGSLTRTPHGRFPEYHTSGDNCELVTPAALADSLRRYREVIAVLEGNALYLNRLPKGEPQLGRRGLYSSLGGRKETRALEMAFLWILNYSDGEHDLLDIADRAALPFELVREAADMLLEKDLLILKEVER